MNSNEDSQAPLGSTAGTHVPDQTRLPNRVTGWRQVEDTTEFCDGSILLLAIPIWHRDRTTWGYEFHVVVVHCDEIEFDLEYSNGDPFDWNLMDADFYVELVR